MKDKGVGAIAIAVILILIVTVIAGGYFMFFREEGGEIPSSRKRLRY